VSWQLARPPAGPLERGEAHVWFASLDAPPVAAERLVTSLTPQENEVAERYRFARERVRSVASRGLLRYLLSAYLSIDPGTVVIDVGPQGKPCLRASNVRFSVSHSEGAVIYALMRGQHIGVDMERLRPMPDAEQIASRFFAPAERDAIRSTPRGQLNRAFFRYWTRKEAYVKALGGGLSIPLDQFDVDLLADWSLHDVSPAPDLVASLAVSAVCELTVRRFCWAPPHS
jgi:4'-phosphopantetheinyl transferase